MATIVNADQLGKSVRNKADIMAVYQTTYDRVLPKMVKRSTERLLTLLPRTRIDSRDHKARAAMRRACSTAITTVLESRGFEIQEWMFGGKTIPNTDYRGEYIEVPRY